MGKPFSVEGGGRGADGMMGGRMGGGGVLEVSRRLDPLIHGYLSILGRRGGVVAAEKSGMEILGKMWGWLALLLLSLVVEREESKRPRRR